MKRRKEVLKKPDIKKNTGGINVMFDCWYVAGSLKD